MAKVLNKAGAKEGVLVSITLSNKELLKGAAILYLLPVTGLMTGGFMGLNFSRMLPLSETVLTIFFSFFGLGLGFAAAGHISRKMSAKNRMIPVIDKIIQSKNRPLPKKLFDKGCHENFCPQEKLLYVVPDLKDP